MPRYLDDTGVVPWLNKGELVVLSLDLTNSYESVAHKLVVGALNWHHSPYKFRDLILD